MMSFEEALNCLEKGIESTEAHDVAKEALREMIKIKNNNPIKVMLDPGAYAPTKAHDTDAGFDIRTPATFELDAYGTIVIDTGVHVEIPKGYVGMIKSKSGLNILHNLVTEGVIDTGYTGQIRVCMRNKGNHKFRFDRGDKITQLVILPIHRCNEMEVVESLDDTERGSNGFGSTGR